jgi:cellulose synthase/poly-beta-1,6-N-acetylglucosamine synthase-like glycosyltransferase
MLAALLLAALIAAPIVTVSLFLSPVKITVSPGGWMQWARRLVRAVLGTVVVTAVAGAGLQALGVTRRNLVAGVIGLALVSFVWLPATRRWNARGHLCWSCTTLLLVAYLAFMLQWTFASHLGVAGVVGSLALWSFEVWAAVLACAYLWELCDALSRELWPRRARTARAAAARAMSDDELPFVSLQVPAYNEPPDMVIETLESLRAIDYPHYQIVVIDDNSDDESLWRPLEAWCREHSVTFAHLEDWPGYKSGALNFALQQMTDPRCELIAVVDSDYQLDPSFLRRCAPLFADPKVGFVQAPQDYRDWEQAHFYRRLYYSYRYFFAVSQPSRNEHDGAIFAGTMGLIRRAALQEVGGWNEWCITEDAELSLRVLRAGYTGLHIDHSFGKGVMPLTFEALKGQRFRWCFGGIQILRRNWRDMLPGTKSARNQLDAGQRWAYLSGAIQWYGDLLALIFFVFLLVGAANVALGGGLLFRKLSGFLVATIPVMAALGIVRAVSLIRRGAGATWREAIGALMIWQSTGLVVARACVQGMFARQAEFLRTPKTAETPSWTDAVRGNPGETVLALCGVVGIVAGLTHLAGYAGPLTAGLLVWPTAAYAAAPLNSLAARKAALPPELRARRHSEYRRSPGARVTVATAGLAVAGLAVVGVLLLLAPGRTPVLAPQLVRRARGQTVRYQVTTTSTTQPGGTPPTAVAGPSTTGVSDTTTATTIPVTSSTGEVTTTAAPAGP